jgi:predicted dehydrogenase
MGVRRTKLKIKFKTMVPGEEGLKDIRVVEAVYRSVAANKKVQI